MITKKGAVNMDRKRDQNKYVAPYATYVLADPDRKNSKTGETKPSEDAAEEAKDWVDHNEK